MRIRLPNRDKNEVFGVIIQVLGSKRFKVACSDNVIRLCRGLPTNRRFVRKSKEGSLLVIRVWEINTDKGDIIHKYGENQKEYLISNGYVTRDFVEV